MDAELYTSWQTSEDVTKNNIQKEMTCCGFYNVNDYPGSECPAAATDGCYTQLKATLNNNITYVYAAVFTLLGFQVLLIIFALVLVCKGGPGGKEIELDYRS